MREAPSSHTHSETPFGPQQRRLDSINAKRWPAIADLGATTESWRRVVKKPQAVPWQAGEGALLRLTDGSETEAC
jgi:hypothetical protein